MAVVALVEHGTRPGYDQVDETGLLVKKTSFKGKREFIEKKMDGNRWASYVRGENPQLTLTVNGVPIPDAGGLLQGICLLHPGNAATILNYTGTDALHGFAAADNRLIVFNDFTFDTSDEEEPTDDMNFTIYQGIAAA